MHICIISMFSFKKSKIYITGRKERKREERVRHCLHEISLVLVDWAGHRSLHLLRFAVNQTTVMTLSVSGLRVQLAATCERRPCSLITGYPHEKLKCKQF